MEPIMALARARGLAVIEDASQAHGAIDEQGRRAGSLGDLACFSFYYAKNLGAYGEAGAVVTSQPALAEQVRLLRSHGEAVRYEHHVLGFNSRLDEIQAAVLRIKLRHLDAWNSLRRQHAASYAKLLPGLPLELPEILQNGAHVYHQFVVRTAERDRVRAELAEAGVQTGVHYPIPIHRQAAWRSLGYPDEALPTTERIASEILSLPMYPELSAEQIEHVASSLARAVRGGSVSLAGGR
jgi:dTDP-4-amino-4,6-dideoxygalactose transaminase